MAELSDITETIFQTQTAASIVSGLGIGTTIRYLINRGYCPTERKDLRTSGGIAAGYFCSMFYQGGTINYMCNIGLALASSYLGSEFLNKSRTISKTRS